MDLTKLKIKGFHYNPDIENKIKSWSYDRDDDEDCWIEISEDTFDADRLIVSFTEKCSPVAITTFLVTEIDFLEEWLNKTVENKKVFSY